MEMLVTVNISFCVNLYPQNTTEKWCLFECERKKATVKQCRMSTPNTTGTRF